MAWYWIVAIMAGAWCLCSMVAYRLLRHDIRRTFGKWTVRDRTFCMVFSAILGAAALVVGLGLNVHRVPWRWLRVDWDRPVDW